MKLLLLLCLATLCCASVYEVPLAKAVVVQHLDADSLHHYEDDVVVPVKHKNVIHYPVHYPGKKYTVHYPSGLYHGPHGLGIYDPKFHDELEHAYYRGEAFSHR